MAGEVDFSVYGPFNNVMPMNQINWASYFAPNIPDGVIAGIGNELQVSASSTGMYAYIDPGECRVRSHRGSLDTRVAIDITEADATYARIDLVVARVTYGAPSTMVITTRQGTPQQTPSAPEPVQTAGNLWEIPLAEVTVPAGAITITPENVKDRRFIYQTGDTAATEFSGTSLAVANDWEYRQAEEIDSLEIILPASPSQTFICGVCFTASAAFTGITFKRSGEAYDIKTTDALTNPGLRYNLTIWWDGAYFWAASKAA